MNRRRGFLSVQGALFLVMGVLALGVLNLGASLSGQHQHERDLARHQQRADELLEPLTLHWQSKHLLEKQGERFGRLLQAGLDGASPIGPDALCRKSARQAFFKRLPEYTLWTFRLTSVGPPYSTVPVHAPPVAPEGKRTMGLAFQCLLELSQTQTPDGQRIKVGTKVLQTLFGAHFLPGTAGQYLRGKPIRVTFRGRFHWLVWDFVQGRDEGGFGYLLLTPDSSALETMALAQSARETVHGRRAFAGYIRFTRSPIGDVLPLPLRRSSSFRQWREGLRKRAADLSLVRADFQAPPLRERLGKWEVFTCLVPHSSHLAVVVVPGIPERGLPGWLLLANLLAGLGVAWVAAHRGMTGNWPELLLSHRLFLTFSLALALPVTLAVMAASSYLTGYRDSLVRQLEERLRKAVGRIDQIRDRSETAYLAACHRALSHPRVLEMLNTGGVGHPGLAAELTGALVDDGRRLPFRKILLTDPFGNRLSTSTARVALPDSDGMVNFYRACMVHALRRKYQLANGVLPPGKNPLTPEDTFLLKGYANLSGLADAAVEIDEQDGSVEIILAGRYLTNRLHRTLVLAPDRMVGLILIWRPADLLDEVLREARAEFEKDNPDCRLWVMARQGGAYKALTGFSGRGRPSDHFLEQAFAGWALRDSPDGDLLFGAKSRTIHDTVLVAAGPGAPVRSRVERLRRFFLLLAFLGSAAVIVIAVTVWQRIGSPVIGVKEALEDVAGGNLEVRLAISRSDELGRLTTAFDHMIQGLGLRSRFASLVSGKALDALSRAESIETAVRGRRVGITALVSDIRSFTTLCEAHPVGEITSLLNRHFETMSGIIEQAGGRVDRFIGDAILVVFEEAPGTDPAAPLNAAIEMIRALAAINRAREADGRFPYAIGIGLASGEAIIGAVGDPDIRLDFAVIGSPMREATKLEALSKRVPQFPIVVSRETAVRSGPWSRHLVSLGGDDEDGRDALVFPPEVAKRLLTGPIPDAGEAP